MRDGGLRLPFPEIDQDMCFVSLIDAYGELRPEVVPRRLQFRSRATTALMKPVCLRPPRTLKRVHNSTAVQRCVPRRGVRNWRTL